MEVDFKFELGAFVKANASVQDRQTGATLISNPKEKYKVLGRAYTEGMNGPRIESAIIYYVTPLHNRLFKKDFKESAETVYTVKQSDLQVWTAKPDDNQPEGEAKTVRLEG